MPEVDPAMAGYHEPGSKPTLPHVHPGAVAQPERDRAGRLTRRGMEEVIRAGGCVHVPAPDSAMGFTLATRVDQLPSEADMAKGDPDKEAAARANLLAQKKQIEDQIAGLGDDRSRVKGGVDQAPPDYDRLDDGALKSLAVAGDAEAGRRVEAREVEAKKKADAEARGPKPR